MSCANLKDCIIFDNGAIDTRMSAAKSAWDGFNEKFGLRKKLLQILVEDFIPQLDKVSIISLIFMCDSWTRLFFGTNQNLIFVVIICIQITSKEKFSSKEKFYLSSAIKIYN